MWKQRMFVTWVLIWKMERHEIQDRHQKSGERNESNIQRQTYFHQRNMSPLFKSCQYDLISDHILSYPILSCHWYIHFVFVLVRLFPTSSISLSLFLISLFSIARSSSSSISCPIPRPTGRNTEGPPKWDSEARPTEETPESWEAVSSLQITHGHGHGKTHAHHMTRYHITRIPQHSAVSTRVYINVSRPLWYTCSIFLSRLTNLFPLV